MIASTLRSNLMTLAKSYAKATATSLSHVSKKFYGNGNFFDEFGSGDKSISIDKYEDVVSAMARDWPPEAEWPFTRAVVLERPRKRGKSIPKK